MRIALISDIHGNLIALEAVLAQIRHEGVDQLICLGDVATFGPQPHEVIERLRDLDCPCITGNHETSFLNRERLRAEDHQAWYIELVAWCAARLSAADEAFLRTFQPQLRVTLAAEANLLCFHGSPKSNTDMILATTPAEELDALLAGQTATVMVGGHTHIQMMRQHKGLMLINAGSVGAPLVEMPFSGEALTLPWAEYAVIGWSNGSLSAELKRVSVDLEKIKQAVLASGLPQKDNFECFLVNGGRC